MGISTAKTLLSASPQLDLERIFTDLPLTRMWKARREVLVARSAAARAAAAVAASAAATET